MRPYRTAIGAAAIAAAAAIAQPPTNRVGPPVVTGPPAKQAPITVLPPEVIAGAGRLPGTAPDVPPPAEPRTPAGAKPEPGAPPPVWPAQPPQHFDAATLRLKRDNGQWQLWAGSLLLKDFGTAEADAYEALGRKDAAAASLESVLKTFPNPRLQQRVDALRK